MDDNEQKILRMNGKDVYSGSLSEEIKKEISYMQKFLSGIKDTNTLIMENLELNTLEMANEILDYMSEEKDELIEALYNGDCYDFEIYVILDNAENSYGDACILITNLINSFNLDYLIAEWLEEEEVIRFSNPGTHEIVKNLQNKILNL